MLKLGWRQLNQPKPSRLKTAILGIAIMALFLAAMAIGGYGDRGILF